MFAGDPTPGQATTIRLHQRRGVEFSLGASCEPGLKANQKPLRRLENDRSWRVGFAPTNRLSTN